MSSPIAPLATVTSPTAPVATQADAHKTTKLHTAAREFESILVKQLLSAAKVGGQKPSGYADMAVDALATGIEKAGGLGLAHRIEETLSHSLSRVREGSAASSPGVDTVGRVETPEAVETKAGAPLSAAAR